MELEKTLQDKVNVSLYESTKTCDACEVFKEKGIQAMSWEWDNCQRKIYYIGELSGVGKQTKRSTTGSKGTEWTWWQSKWRETWSMDGMRTSTQRLWGP